MGKIKLAPEPPKTKKKRGPNSRIGYPYYNLEDSVHVAKIVHEKGGGTCGRDQLASFLNYAGTNSGAYLSRLSSARTFGLIEVQSGNVSVTERARNIFAPVMEDDKIKAKVEAFLAIDLFKNIYERFKGNQIPPSVGIKNLLQNDFKIVKDRVTPAHRVLMESAEYAGFFATHGDQTRLITPTLETERAHKPSTETEQKEEKKINPTEKSKGGGESGGPPTGIHTAIIGLLRELPSPGPWEKSHKEGFMQAFKSTIDFIYPEKKEGES